MRGQNLLHVNTDSVCVGWNSCARDSCAQRSVRTAQSANDIRAWQMGQSAPKRGKDLAEEYNFILR